MIHLAVDGPIQWRLTLLASAMLLGRRTQQQIHLYWKDPILPGDNYHQYFQAVSDIKLRQWFPELKNILLSQHPRIHIQTNQTNQTNHNQTNHQTNPTYPTPEYHNDYFFDLIRKPISLPENSIPRDAIFMRQEPGTFLKSTYEKLLSKFARKFVPNQAILKHIQRHRFHPQKPRIGIYLHIEDRYYANPTQEVIKRLLQQFHPKKFQIFFSSNYHIYQEEISSKYKQLRTFPHFRKTQNQRFDDIQLNLADTYLLSSCQKIITINPNPKTHFAWLLSSDITPLQIIRITED